jgi:hypothetical protein
MNVPSQRQYVINMQNVQTQSGRILVSVSKDSSEMAGRIVQVYDEFIILFEGYRPNYKSHICFTYFLYYTYLYVYMNTSISPA